MLTSTQETALKRLSRYATKYEIVASHADGRHVFIGYSGQRSKHGLLRMLQHNGELNIARLGLTDESKVASLPNSRIQVGDWIVAFSGRTQREAITAGEMPWLNH